MLRQELTILKVHECYRHRLQGFLSEIPRTGPSQAVVCQPCAVSHFKQSHVGALPYHGCVLVQQEIVRAGLPASGMGKILAEACPLIDFKEEIGEINVGNTAAHLVVQGLNLLRYVRPFIRWYDQLAILNADAIATVQYPIDTR